MLRQCMYFFKRTILNCLVFDLIIFICNTTKQNAIFKYSARVYITCDCEYIQAQHLIGFQMMFIDNNRDNYELVHSRHYK